MRGGLATVTGFAWRALLGGRDGFNRAARLRSRDTLGLARVLGLGPSAWCARTKGGRTTPQTADARGGLAGRSLRRLRTWTAWARGYRWALLGREGGGEGSDTARGAADPERGRGARAHREGKAADPP